MANTNKNWSPLSDQTIISSIGAFIKHHRLLQNQTQTKVAEVAGVNRWTMGKIEKGEAISLLSLIQILRALDRLELLDVFKVKAQISPLRLAKLEQEKRQRASSKTNNNSQSKSEW